ncbi:hypothetical protein NDR87_31020 [Nocardia sp. CDC159]|uniref:Uncharacterized protein n=1 Tax=Nocardia pulmonis TaxID=2951408 RepID=A0A9X2EBX2_9NOCA|nr:MULTISPECIES: hypothetical protein [Nocardia]MCM6778017.1 hypothetical protein [Nocardia pulmonis]MCM6790812.1 hypothetical protein [Nocardia sp. CDC159]
MSFLLRRNLPLAWAGWLDDFKRPPENPVKRPWVHLGDGTTADINALEELHIPSNYASNNAGGESYEFQPFTPNSGFEMEFWWPVEGLAAQGFGLYFTDTWARVGATFANAVGVRLWHRAEGLGGEEVYFVEYPSIFESGTFLGVFQSPVPFFGNTLTLRVWFDDDRWMRAWLNGNFIGARTIEPTFRLGPGRRCIRTSNTALCDAWVRWVDHYDRPSSIPSAQVWSSVFYDDFNRANGDPGNGWTQIGTNASIQNNSWSTTGTTDGSRGLIRDTGIASGKIRIEATVGGNTGINNTADSGLVLCSNSAGTQGLCANIFGNRVFLSRFSTALSSNPPTFTDFDAMQSGIAIGNGDLLAFSVYNGNAWLEVNGERVLYATGIHSVVPATNSYAGLRVERASSNNSNAWNDVRIYSGV